jgi:hypothetical protein
MLDAKLCRERLFDALRPNKIGRTTEEFAQFQNGDAMLINAWIDIERLEPKEDLCTPSQST